MTDNEKNVSRADVLAKLAMAPIAIGALAALRAEADAAATMDQKAAGYVTHPVKGQQCSGCSLYIPAKTNPSKNPGSCKVVKGSILPNGWCKLYQAKAH